MSRRLSWVGNGGTEAVVDMARSLPRHSLDKYPSGVSFIASEEKAKPADGHSDGELFGDVFASGKPASSRGREAGCWAPAARGGA